MYPAGVSGGVDSEQLQKLGYARTLVMLFILPMWVNILVRTLATVALFDFFRLPLGEGP